MLEQPNRQDGQGQEKRIEQQVQTVDLMQFVGLGVQLDVGGFAIAAATVHQQQGHGTGYHKTNTQLGTDHLPGFHSRRRRRSSTHIDSSSPFRFTAAIRVCERIHTRRDALFTEL